MATDHASQVEVPRRRYGWRLKILLGLSTLLLGLLVLSRLSLSQAKLLGPWGQSVYEVVNPPAVQELSLSGRRLVAEVKALGGEAHLTEHTPGFLGHFGGTDSFYIRLNGTEFGDEDLVPPAPEARQSHLGARPSQHKSHRRGAWTPERDVQP